VRIHEIIMDDFRDAHLDRQAQMKKLSTHSKNLAET